MGLDDPSYQISALKRELEDKDKNLILAAQIGKNLLEENSQLNLKLEETAKENGLKIEALKQEIYSLNLKLESQETVLSSAQTELDQQEKIHNNEVMKIHQNHKEINEKLSKKISSQDNLIGSLQNDLQFKTTQIEELQSALQASSDKLETEMKYSMSSIIEDNSSQKHEHQLLQLTNEKQNLEKELSSLSFELKSTQHQLVKFKRAEESLNTELEEKECEFTSLFNTLQKSKDENEELRVEIDNMKLQLTDPTRKGNSIFAEVEDNRKHLEQALLSLMEKYDVSKKQCEIKTNQITQMKLQMASLLMLNQTEIDQGYINHLEESLYDLRKQLTEYSEKCKGLEESLQRKSDQEKELAEDLTKEDDDGNFFKHLYHQSKAKISKLEGEMETLRFSKVSLSDQLHQMKRKAYALEKERDALNGKIIQLNVRIDEMLGGTNSEKDEERPKPAQKTEILPWFKEKQEEKEGKILKPAKENLISNGISTFEGKSPKNSLLKENRSAFPVSCTGIHIKEKRIKKTIKLTETIQVFEEDSKISNQALKEHDGGNKPQKLPKALRKVEAPLIDYTSSQPPEECKQQ